MPSCLVRSLPADQLVAAAKTAIAENPVNHPPVTAVAAQLLGVSPPERIAMLTTKYWGPTVGELLVQFLDNPDAETRRLILRHMNAWHARCGFRFRETRANTAHVRISRVADGYWSYLGTDVMHIPDGQPTMNLQGFTTRTPESEYRRVVRHETGHTMGFPHEHMRREIVDRIDPTRAYAYFGATQGWTRQDIDQQVLTPLEDVELTAGPAEETSIMCYQLPAEITRDGREIEGGTDITEADYRFAEKVYPRSLG